MTARTPGTMTRSDALDRIKRAATDALATAEQAVNHLRDLEDGAGSAGPDLDPGASDAIRSDHDHALAAISDAQRQLARASKPLALLLSGQCAPEPAKS